MHMDSSANASSSVSIKAGFGSIFTETTWASFGVESVFVRLLTMEKVRLNLLKRFRNAAKARLTPSPEGSAAICRTRLRTWRPTQPSPRMLQAKAFAPRRTSHVSDRDGLPPSDHPLRRQRPHKPSQAPTWPRPHRGSDRQ